MTKLLLFLAVFVALWLLLRRLNASADQYPPPSQPGPPIERRPPVTIIDAELPRATAHDRSVDIRGASFVHIDFTAGPARPEAFFDELLVDAYYRDSGHGSQYSFDVATPRGLAEELARRPEGWVYSPALIVVPRFDMDQILRAVLDHLHAADAAGDEERPRLPSDDFGHRSPPGFNLPPRD